MMTHFLQVTDILKVKSTFSNILTCIHNDPTSVSKESNLNQYYIFDV